MFLCLLYFDSQVAFLVIRHDRVDLVVKRCDHQRRNMSHCSLVRKWLGRWRFGQESQSILFTIGAIRNQNAIGHENGNCVLLKKNQNSSESFASANDRVEARRLVRSESSSGWKCLAMRKIHEWSVVNRLNRFDSINHDFQLWIDWSCFTSENTVSLNLYSLKQVATITPNVEINVEDDYSFN